MKPEINKISQISPDQSVICILGKRSNTRMAKSEQIRKGVCSETAEWQRKNIYLSIHITNALIW